MIKNKSYNYAFTIVELLVVIVVIGILAAISIVSYTGVANKANVASIKSDLANSSKRIKMYYALYDKYPTMSAPGSDGSICPTSPIDTNYCLKPSADTSFSYMTDSDPNVAYVLIATKANMSYRISEGIAPTLINTPLAPAITAVTPNGATQMTLNWTAPSFDGGSAITGYKIYKGTSSGSLALAYTIGNVLTYVDSSGISAGNTYYYKVLAVNSNGDGNSSNELSGIPVLVAATGGTVTTSGGYKYHTFTSSGTFNVTTSGIVDVFIVGGGGRGGGVSGGCPGGGGYTKTFKDSVTGWRDGGAIAVSAGENISVTVGAGGNYSQFKDSTYRADPGGNGGEGISAGSGGSGGGGSANGYSNSGGSGGSDGSNGVSANTSGATYLWAAGSGQGHTTRAFGEATGTLYAGGGGGAFGGAAGAGGGGYGAGTGGSGTGGNGAANTGGGGGGSFYAGYSQGGSGIVIVRYASL